LKGRANNRRALNSTVTNKIEEIGQTASSFDTTSPIKDAYALQAI
jgi:hypothetical protein